MHQELGYFPDDFQVSCRSYVSAYLKKIEDELQQELRAVRETRTDTEKMLKFHSKAGGTLTEQRTLHDRENRSSCLT